jgi:hypothetical protein
MLSKSIIALFSTLWSVSQEQLGFTLGRQGCHLGSAQMFALLAHEILSRKSTTSFGNVMVYFSHKTDL